LTTLAPFIDVFRQAHARGLHITHHAGEALGPESIRAAISLGGAERIGHGISALQDQALVEQLRARQIPLEVCPSSNVALGFSSSLAAHPFAALADAGLAVTINTDIPSMIATPLAVEYGNIRATFGYDHATMAAFALAGVNASFAPPAIKERLRAEIGAWLAVA
jgi:adenosine deaminase